MTRGHVEGGHRVCAGVDHLLFRWYRECRGFVEEASASSDTGLLGLGGGVWWDFG